jgi:hypothetical protein
VNSSISTLETMNGLLAFNEANLQECTLNSYPRNLPRNLPREEVDTRIKEFSITKNSERETLGL